MHITLSRHGMFHKCHLGQFGYCVHQNFYIISDFLYTCSVKQSKMSVEISICSYRFVCFFLQLKCFFYHLFCFFFFSFKFYFIIIIFYFTMLYWFCHTSTCIRHECTRVPHPEPPFHHPPQTIPLGHPSAPAPSILYPASKLFVCLFLVLCSLPVGV